MKKQSPFIEHGLTDEGFGILINPETGESSFEGLPYSGTQCTGYACRLKQLFKNRVKVYGFDKESNPVTYDFFEGHDFAVFNDRFILDPWFIMVVGEDDALFVADLENPNHSEYIKARYGNPSLWERMVGVEKIACEND